MQPDSSAGFAATLCLLLVAAGGTVGGVAAPQSGVSAGPGDVTADDVLVDIAVAENGTATWTVEYRVRLDDENTTAAFEELQADVAANSTRYADRFGSRLESTVGAAAEATGREMALGNVSVSTSIRQLPRRYGVVTYRFRWEGFAVVSDGRLDVGDALRGLFLDDRTRLLVTWPEGYELRSVEPEPDVRRDRAVGWAGPMEFRDDRPNIAVQRAKAEDGRAGIGGAALLLGGAGVAVVAVAVAVGVRRSGRSWSELPGIGPAAAYATRGDSGTGPDAPPSDATAEDDTPTELLSSEERVLRVLRENGGRMKQAAVGDALGWSDARTSQVVGSLRNEGRVESFRLGRENVLRLVEEST
jgi:hypothetical protein